MQLKVSNPPSGLSIRADEVALKRFKEALFGDEPPIDTTIFVELVSCKKDGESGFDVSLRLVTRQDKGRTSGPVAQFGYDSASPNLSTAQWLRGVTPHCPLPMFGALSVTYEQDGRDIFLRLPPQEQLPKAITRAPRPVTALPTPAQLQVPKARVTVQFTDKKHEFELPASEAMDTVVAWIERGLKVPS